MSRQPGQSARDLYEDEKQGRSDVSNRLSSNTALGTLDFTAALMQHLDLEDGLKLLDVGCGPGHHLAAFQKRYALDSHGIDPFIDGPAHPDITFQRASADQIPYDDGSFDRVMCNYALYYVDAWDRAVDEMIRVARPAGRIVITGPGRENNAAFYDLHQRLFGALSDIDRHALGFLDRLVEPYLESRDATFRAHTLENRIVYPTLDDFLGYYTSTSLYRITTQDHDPAEMQSRIREAVRASFEAGRPFVNTKKIRMLIITEPV